MFKIILHGTDSCETCLKVQNRLTISKIPFEYDDVAKSNNNSYAVLPVTEVRNINNQIIEQFIGILKDRELNALKVYMKANLNYN